MNSEPQKVVGLVSAFGTDGIYVITRDYPDKAIRPIMLTHRQPEPPDSWKKLEADAKKSVCDYADAPHDEDGLITCDGCRFHESMPCYEVTAKECAEKREMRMKRTMEEYDDYCGTTVECVELIDDEVPSRKSRGGSNAMGR